MECYIQIRAVKRLNYLIAINRKLFFYATYPLIFLSHNSSHFNSLINMVNDFLLITTLAYTLIKTGRYKKRAYSAIKRLL